MVRSRPSSILMSPDYIISSSSSKELVSSTAKRIRFAPLPEPDREGHPNDSTSTPQIPTYTADPSDPDSPPEDLLASSNSSSSSSINSTSTPLIPGQSDLEKSSPDSSVGSSPIILLTSLPSKSIVSDYIISPTVSSHSEPPSPKKSLPFLRPFKRFYTSGSSSSSNTLTPTPSIDNHTHGDRKSITKEEILTLGVVNLFRTASRESTQSLNINRPRGSSFGGSSISLPVSSPLSRSQSNQSRQSKSTSRFSSSSTFFSSDQKAKTKAKPASLGQQSRNRHKGTVMLNGRVYGAKKDANPFANIRDEEPEFVEWGYGGMGSVKGAKSAGVSSNWDKLHGGSTMARDIEVGVGGVGAGIGATDPVLDDGSGLAWVRRRKEERERKAREQQEKEAETESQTNTPTRCSTVETLPGVVSMPSIPHCAVETATTQRSPAIDIPPLAIDPENSETATKSNFPTPTPPSELGLSPSSSPYLTGNNADDKSEGETNQLHNTHVVNVPVRSPRRSSSRGGREMSVSAERPTVAPYIQVAESPILVSPSGDDTMDASTDVLHTSTLVEIGKLPHPSSSSSSESESGSEVDDEEDGDDEDDEEEYEQQNTLGHAAGLEKISRRNGE